MPTYKLNEKKKWEILSEGEDRENSIVLPDKLVEKLEKVKKDLKNDLDVVALIVGDVGSGKSTLGRLCCRYVSDEKFNPRQHMIRSVDDIREVIKNAKRGDAVLFDEGSGIFSSTDTLSKKTKYANLVLDVCRGKNLFLIIIAPYFHRIGTSVAIDRSKFLLRTFIDTKTGRKGKMCYYSEKRKEKLYYHIKKNGTLRGVKPNFRSTFGMETSHEELYQEMKSETLDIVLDSFGKKTEEKAKPKPEHEVIRDYRLDLIKKNMETPGKYLMTTLGIAKSQFFRLKKKAKEQLEAERESSSEHKRVPSPPERQYINSSNEGLDDDEGEGQ